MGSFSGDEVFAEMERAAEERPTEEALHLVLDAAGTTRSFARARVLELARRGAAHYRARGLAPGARVLVDLPTGEAFFAALLGALHAGLVPASVAPFEHRNAPAGEAEWRDLLERLRPARVVSSQAVDAGGVPVDAGADLLAADPSGAGPRAAGSAMSYVQFSSGSTGTPKALLLEMPGIVFNLEAMIRRIPLEVEDHIVSWLPMYHDMGLFGTLMNALYRGCALTLMDTSLFIRSPMLWLRVLHDAGGTITVGPPSAYRAVLELLRRRPQSGIDLSRCTRYICGAEQVTPRLVESFAEVMPAYGVPAAALKPVYGMSEITLTATMPPSGRGPLVDEVDQAAFEDRSVAVPASGAGARLGWVSVGRILDGQDMKIVGEDGGDLGDREVGRVLLRSPSLYTAVVDGDVRIPREGEWMDTGDLGYRVGPELFITGRAREIIIKGGRNLSPERIEELACSARQVSRAAAFGVFDDQRQTERVVVFAEVHANHLREARQRDALRLALRTELGAAGYEIDEVVFVDRGSLPRTTSGKIRRQVCRQEYLASSASSPSPS